MSTFARPQGRRGPSGAWSRLKPVAVDPLEAYGLPSKGETKLHDHKNQESYHRQIMDRYMKSIASSGGGEQLEKAFAALSLKNNSSDLAMAEKHQKDRPALPNQGSASGALNDMPTILMAMRKLREGILGSHRRDQFAQRAYIFIIQACILTRHWEGYQPALLYLLDEIHPVTPLPSPELRDMVTYRILDLACRQHELMEAYELRQQYALRDRRLDTILKSIVHDDWVRFWRLRKAVDGYQRSLMDHAVHEMREHALKCLGRAYLNVERSFVERTADASWHDLVHGSSLVQGGVGWVLQENGMVMIRKPKPK